MPPLSRRRFTPRRIAHECITKARLVRLAQITAAGLTLLCATTAHAQTPASATKTATTMASPAKDLAFHGWDVISVKPNKSGSGSMRISSENTTFFTTNASLMMMLSNAYGIREGLITGVPAWAKDSHWDINAKLVDPDPALKDLKQTREEGQARYHAKVLNILTERFHLKAHTEEKEGPTFDLVVAKGGPKITKATPAEEGHGGSNWHNSTLKATALPLSSFARMMEGEAGRNITDKTGLVGDYDFELRWTREDQAITAADTGATDKPPTLFTAMEEQLGLRLVPAKGLVTTLVIDSIEPPVED